MAQFPFDILGFDLDGTLLDTRADLTAALNAGLAAVGRPGLPIEAATTMIGAGIERLVARGLAATGGGAPAVEAKALGAMLDHYAAHIADATRPYPGAEAAIEALAARGVRLAVVTNKREALAVSLLRATGLLPAFAAVIGGDTLGPGTAKPSPAPLRAMIARCGGGRAAFVGDSIHDIEAARAASIPVVAARFGYGLPADALALADGAVDHFAELLPALARIGGD